MKVCIGYNIQISIQVIIIFCVVGIITALPAFSATDEQNLPSPVVLIPGLGGSQAFGRWKYNPSKPITPLWINLEYFIYITFLREHFELIYNVTSHTTHDGPLMDVLFPGWGETWSIENLDSTQHSQTEYFKTLVSRLLQDPFYVCNKTLRGAPYDFRKTPMENQWVLPALKSLIEETYANSGNRRVALISHSMGSIYTLHFLQSLPDSWKAKYVRAFMSVSGPFGGSMKAVKMMASGENFGFVMESPLHFRPIQRSMPSSAFMLPRPGVWSDEEVLVTTPNRNYTVNDYEQLFADMNFDDGYSMWLDSLDIIDPYTTIPTGVAELYCLHGVGVNTAERLIYKPAHTYRPAFPDQQPSEIYGDGDGTVGTRSLKLCGLWPEVTYQTFSGSEHNKILRNNQFVDYVVEVLLRGE